MRYFFAIACFLISVSPSRAEYVAQWNMRQQTYAAVYEALHKNDFAALEEVAETYRSKRSRMPDGTWQLYVFYRAFDGCVPPTGREGELAVMTDKFKSWMAAYPSSPTPVIAYASFLKAVAWTKRGNRYAAEIWAADLAAFNQQIVEIDKLLDSAKSFADRDPKWYSLKIAILIPQPVKREHILKVAREGAAKEPAYYHTYVAAMSALFPQWGGSAEEMQAWADEAVQLSGDVTTFARVYWFAFESVDQRFFRDVDWKRLEKSTDATLAAFPSPDLAITALGISCNMHDAARVEKYANLVMTLDGQTVSSFDAGNYCGWGTAQMQKKDVVRPEDLPQGNEPKRTSH